MTMNPRTGGVNKKEHNTMPKVGSYGNEGLPLGETVVVIDDVKFVPKALKFEAPKDSPNPNDYEQRWTWIVKSAPDENGKQITKYIDTGVDYGAGNAKLTKWLNGIFKTAKLTAEQFEALDFFKMKGVVFIIGMGPNQKQDGTIFSWAKQHPDYPVKPEQFFEDATSYTPQQLAQPVTPPRPATSPAQPAQMAGGVSNPFGGSRPVAGQSAADF